MKTIEENLKAVILERFGSVSKFTKEIGMANSTFTTIMTRGVHKASISNVIKICQALDISVDELAQDRIVPNSKSVPVTDLGEMVKFLQMDIVNNKTLILDGQLLTDDMKEMMINALDLCVELVRRQNK